MVGFNAINRKNMEDEVILVNEQDEVIGLMPKLEAHQLGALHRAFSVFIFNSKGEILLQQRALHKYHSAGLWSNTCCSHPLPNETTQEAAQRRLKEEMGLKTNLTFLYSFIYKEPLENNLTEHELDHVFFGVTDDIPQINLDEVMEWTYSSKEEVLTDILQAPAKYTIWFKICIEELFKKIEGAGNHF